MLVKLLRPLVKYKYEILLLSLFIHLFGLILIPKAYYYIFRPLFLLQAVLPGVLLYAHSSKRYWVMLTFVLLICSYFIELLNGWSHYTLSAYFYILYFLAISSKVYIDIYRAQKISSEMIAALFSGFLLVGIIGSFLLVILESAVPGSFSNIAQNYTLFEDFQYFSFITILTIGYGDIIPLTHQAKKLVVFMGLMGHFYTVFVSGIVIGKYLTSNNDMHHH